MARALGVPHVVHNCNALNFPLFPFLPPPPHLPLGLSAIGLGELSVGGWRFWAQRMAYPLVAAATLLAERMVLERQLNEARALSGLQAVAVSEWMVGRLILVNAVLGHEYARTLPPLVRMTGPLIDMRPEAESEWASRLSATERQWLEARQQAIDVAFGTIAPLTDATLHVLHDALAQLSANYTVVWKLSPALAALLPSPPPSLHVAGWVSSPAALLCHSRLALFVSHCGTHSLHESLHCATPVLCLPIQGDQQENAQHLADSAAGAFLPVASHTAQQLVQHVQDMLAEDSGYERGAARMSGLVRLAGGLEAAASWVECVAKYGTEGLLEAGEGWRLWVRQAWDVMAVWCALAWPLALACRRVVRWSRRRCKRPPKEEAAVASGVDGRANGDGGEGGRKANGPTMLLCGAGEYIVLRASTFVARDGSAQEQRRAAIKCFICAQRLGPRLSIRRTTTSHIAAGRFSGRLSLCSCMGCVRSS